MWNVKCFVIPAATGATGIVTTEIRNTSAGNTRQSLNRLLAKWLYWSNTQVLHSETSRLSCGVHHWIKRIIVFLSAKTKFLHIALSLA